MDILPARHSVQNSKAHGTQESGYGLHTPTCRLGTGLHSVQHDDTSLDSAVDQEGKSHTCGDTEEHRQGIYHSCRTCNIILIGQVTDAVRERNTGNKRDKRADDHVTGMFTESNVHEHDR